MTINNLWSTPPRRASKGCSSNKRREGEAKGYGLTRPANHYTLASCPPSKTRRHVYWKGGIVNKRYDELIMKKLRPGSLKDYAKYFAESLAILPVVNSIINNHKKQKQ